MKIGWELDLTKEIERSTCKCGNGCIVIYEHHYSSKKPPYKSEVETEYSLYCKTCDEVNQKVENKKNELARFHGNDLKRIENDFRNIIVTIVGELNSCKEVTKINNLIKSKKKLYSILNTSRISGALGTFYKEHNNRSISGILKYYTDSYMKHNNLEWLQKYTTNLYSQLNLDISDYLNKLFKEGEILKEEETNIRKCIKNELLKYESELYASMN